MRWDMPRWILTPDPADVLLCQMPVLSAEERFCQG